MSSERHGLPPNEAPDNCSWFTGTDHHFPLFSLCSQITLLLTEWLEENWPKMVASVQTLANNWILERERKREKTAAAGCMSQGREQKRSKLDWQKVLIDSRDATSALVLANGNVWLAAERATHAKSQDGVSDSSSRRQRDQESRTASSGDRESGITRTAVAGTERTKMTAGAASSQKKQEKQAAADRMPDRKDAGNHSKGSNDSSPRCPAVVLAAGHPSDSRGSKVDPASNSCPLPSAGSGAAAKSFCLQIWEPGS